MESASWAWETRAQAARKENLALLPPGDDLEAAVRGNVWEPRYLPYRLRPPVFGATENEALTSGAPLRCARSKAVSRNGSRNCRSLGSAPNEQAGSGCSAGLDTQSRRDDLKVAQDVSPGLELEEKGSPGGTAESIPLQPSLRDWPNC